ncbi:MAG: 16S rRNA (cytidine(1402)-2'-O)-methyltransferase [Acidimicrobiales bacterium]|nr:16S rRNA (cytidine(1402)-2'-O)-methyltransferase [Acidimicrobiales bacterium]
MTERDQSHRGSPGSDEGVLILVGTPIGNLADLSPRGVDALASADVVACEDTRRTGRLLQHAGISAPRLLRVDEHTEAAGAAEIVDLVGAGRTVALVTDAGMPGISDPGERVVAAVVDAGLAVDCIPGPSSVLMALVLSGLSTARFAVEGFLPRKGPARRSRLAEVAAERRTVVVLESPHRVVATIDDLVAACGPHRRVALARELTKLHQEVWRGTLSEAGEHLAEHPPRGEYVLVLDGAPEPEEATDTDIIAALRQELDGGASRRDAAATVAARLGVSRRRVYSLALEG